MFRLLFVLAVVVAIANGLKLPAIQMLDGRIIGGKDVEIQNYPHQISLRYKSTFSSTFSHSCGGSIYNNYVIVTAAHCLSGRSASNIRVVVGETTITNNSEELEVRKIVTNSKYSSSTIDNDVGLVFLVKPLTFGTGIQPIALAKVNPAPGTNAVVTGWGTTKEGGSLSSTLQVVDVDIVSNEECASSYGSNPITSNMLCAGTEKGGKDACQGDSGGPLVANDVLVGIVSWGIGCARPDYPGVYTSVAAVADWIEETARE